jgi:hypothetical protein
MRASKMPSGIFEETDSIEMRRFFPPGRAIGARSHAR